MTKDRLLIVDDEADIRRLLRIRLELAGFECAEAGDGDEALLVAREFKPSLVILDLVMPGKDGLQTYKEFKSYKELNGVPILVYTAQNPDLIAEKGFEAMEIVDFVLKPFDSKALIYLIESSLKKNRPSSAPEGK
jgi:two-component system, OmpR family, response regulator